MMNKRGIYDYIQLREFIRKGDDESVQRLIMNSAQTIANRKSSFDTPLHWAVRFNDLTVIKTLIDAQVDFRVKNHRNQSPLELAVTVNQANVVLMFLNGGVYSRKLYRSMVYQATCNGNAEMVNLLIDHAVKNNVLLNLKNSLNLAVGKEYVRIVRSILPYCKFEPNEKSMTIHVWKTSQNFRECIRLLFEHGYIINPRDYDFYFIYVAINNNHAIIIRELLKKGMDSNYSDKKTGYSLLHAACFTQQFDIVKILIDNNATINAKYVKCTVEEEASPDEKMNCGLTPLDFAVNNLNVQITRLLLEKGASLAESKVFLNIAEETKDYKRNCRPIIELLVEYIIDGNAPLCNGNNFLQYFVKYGRYFQMTDYDTVNNIVTLLIKKGASVDAIDSRGYSLLYIAIHESFFEMFRVLLEQGANIDLRTLQDEHVLHAAACQYDSRFIDVILSYNIPINDVCNRNWTSLHYAAYYGSVKVVKILLQHNAEVNIKNQDGNTPLFLAVTNNNQRIVHILLDNNAEVNAYNSYFYTPLFLATMSANIKIMKILLEYKADVNARDRIQCVPLHHATAFAVQLHCNNKIVQLLLDNNAEVNAADTSGSTALHYATSGCNVKIAKMLLENNADANIKNTNGQTPFFYAMQHSNIVLIRIMLENNADAKVRDKDDRTPIFYMSLAKHELVPEIIRLLLLFGVNVDCYDQDSSEKSLLYNAQHVAKNNATVKSFMEIEKLKTEKIEGTSITFYNLLKKNIHCLSRYANNIYIRKALEDKIYDEQLPLTIDIIRDRFAEGIAKNDMVKTVQEHAYLDIFNELPPNCMDKVFSYVTTEEVETFLEAANPRKFGSLRKMVNQYLKF